MMFIGIIVYALLWGLLTQWVIKEKKGYDKNWFWWGFFFGVIAFLIALSRPQNERQTITVAPYSPDRSPVIEEVKFHGEGWECKRCSNMNPKDAAFCQCGFSLYENERTDRKDIDSEEYILKRIEAANKSRELLNTGEIDEAAYKALNKRIYEMNH